MSILTDGDILEQFEDAERLKRATMSQNSMVTPDGDLDDMLQPIQEADDAPDRCPECGMANAIYVDIRQGLQACRNPDCRVVIDSHIADYSAEWRQAGTGEDAGGGENSARCGGASNPWFPEASLGTGVSGNSRIQRQSAWNAMPGVERSRYKIFTFIDSMCNRGKLKKCVSDDAKDFWFQIKNHKEPKGGTGKKKGKTNINRGNTQITLIAACILFACSNRKMPVSHQWMASLFGVENEEMTAGCRLFLDKAEQCGLLNRLNTNVPVEYIQLARNSLRLGKETFELAMIIAKNAVLLNLATEHMPNSTAAACILMASAMNRLSITKQAVAKAFEISDVTITKAYKKLLMFRKVLYSTSLTLQAVEIITGERQTMLQPFMSRNLMKV
jgi:transcription initiation factor TFIIIB Brf1 subunit/transcription initiation factor TFIIB